MSRILIVEDEKKIARFLELELAHEGYEVRTAGDGRTGLDLALSWQPDLMILDLMLPELSGIEVCRRLRHESDLPIIMLTAKDDVSDKVMGLDMGADDYITKPFNPLELIARIRSNIRRYYSLGSQAEAEAKESRQIRVGDLVLDEDSVTLKKGDQVITITPTEYKMLSLFMKSPGKVFTKMQIYQAVNGECYVNDDNTLMVHISNLRDKIEDNPREPRYIKNIRGIGYKIEKL